jgi:hypothetical protein
MRDFLDNLIERHVDVAPQIKPRLPSIFEPEVPQGGLDVAAPDSNVPEIEEMVSGGPPVRREEIALSHVAATDPSPTVIQAMQPRAASAPTVPARKEKPSVKAGLDESVFSLSRRETPTLPPPSQGGSEEGVRGLNEGFPKSSVATLIAPVMGRVRHAHQEERMEHSSPNPQATAEDQPSVKEGLSKPVFFLSPRETPTLPPPSQGGSEEGVRGLNQALLKPSATLIAPALPSVARLEKPVPQPEPVINVTIGRIEVRASMSPQKQAPKPESRTPVMGLEEYLRRRSGGHDR